MVPDGEAHQLLTRFGRSPQAVARVLGEDGDGRRRGQSLESSGALLAGDEVPADAPGDPRRGVLDRVPREMSVPRGRLHLCVTEQLPDHREALAQGQCPRSIECLRS